MRSIGKVKIRQLKKMCQEEYEKEKTVERVCGPCCSGYKVERVVMDRIPDEWFETWERAYSEIERTIEDELNRLIYKGGV